MGVPGIHIEQIFGSFGEKPGEPFSVHAPRAWRRFCGEGRW